MPADAGVASSRAQALRGVLIVLAYAAALTVLAAVLYGRAAAKSVAVGGLVATANFYVMARMVASLVGAASGAGGSRSAGAWRATSPFKLLGFFGVVGIVLLRHLADAVPFVCGYGALPLGMLTWAYVTRPREGGDLPSQRVANASSSDDPTKIDDGAADVEVAETVKEPNDRGAA